MDQLADRLHRGVRIGLILEGAVGGRKHGAAPVPLADCQYAPLLLFEVVARGNPFTLSRGAEPG